MGPSDGSESQAFPCLAGALDDPSRVVQGVAGKRSRPHLAIYFALAAHVLIDLALLIGPWQFTDPVLIFVVAWPMSQNGLIAIWATTTRGASCYWRYAAAVAGMSWTWFLSIALMPGIAIYGQESAGWAAAYAAQSVVIVLVGAAYRLLARQILAWRARGVGGSRRLQFSIAFLLLWTALIAVTLGLGRSASTQFGWTSEVLRWKFFALMPVIGICNAAYTLLVLFSLADRMWRVGRIAAVGIIIGVLGYGQPYVMQLFSGTALTAITAAETLALAGSQAVYLYATLLPLRLVQRYLA